MNLVNYLILIIKVTLFQKNKTIHNCKNKKVKVKQKKLKKKKQIVKAITVKNAQGKVNI